MDEANHDVWPIPVMCPSVNMGFTHQIGDAIHKGPSMLTFTEAPSEAKIPSQADQGSRSPGGPSMLPGLAAVLFTGAIFGFFYAWVCSTMWGLDDADPRVAIEAMQAMNGSVRNAVFAPAFFATPIVVAAAAWFARRDGAPASARWFTGAAVVYFVGGMLLTMAFNVPMNEELAAIVVPSSIEAADIIWNDYSAEWQVYNILRTVFSGASLIMTAIGLATLNRGRS